MNLKKAIKKVLNKVLFYLFGNSDTTNRPIIAIKNNIIIIFCVVLLILTPHFLL